MKNANVSVALCSGNDVATEVAQIILLDDNFGSLLTLIKNGRLTYRNIRKVIIYLFPGGCVGEMVPNFLSIFLGYPAMLTNFCQAMIPFVTDVFASISLIMEKEESDLMLQQPRSLVDNHLVDWKFFFHAYGFVGLLIVLFSNTLFFLYMSTYASLGPLTLAFTFGNEPTSFSNVTSSGAAALSYNEYLYEAQTLTFVTIIILNIVGSLMTVKTNKRSFFLQAPWHPATRNLWPYAASLVAIVICALVVFLPPLQATFSTRSVPISLCVLALVFGMVIFALDELRKLCIRFDALYLSRIAW